MHSNGKYSNPPLVVYLFNGILYILYPFIYLYFILRLNKDPNVTGTMADRFGFFRKMPDRADKSPVIWLHAVSVGEAAAASGILEGLRKRYPNAFIIITTTTKTGYEMAVKRLNGYDYIDYYPFDFPWVVRRAVNRIKPDIYLCLETEYWPNLIRALNRSGAKKILLNGRVSDAMRNSPRWLRPMYEFIFDSYEALGMQADTDAARIRALGASPEKVHITGNLKFEGSYLRVTDGELRDYRDRLKIKLGDKVVIAGSTHPGEEDMMMQAFIVLKNIYPSMKLIIAPRAIERTEAVEEIVEQWGFKSSRFSELDGFKDVNEIIIVDVIGELAQLYAIGQAAYIGGSLVERGGQNLLEPVSQGVPAVHGPYVHNFRDMAAFLGDTKRACAYKVSDVHELSLLLKFLIEDDERIAETRERCFRAVEEGSGATGRSLELIAEVIGG